MSPLRAFAALTTAYALSCASTPAPAPAPTPAPPQPQPVSTPTPNPAPAPSPAPLASTSASLALPSPPSTASSNTWGDAIGEAFGAGGLAIGEVGEGGGGRGEIAVCEDCAMPGDKKPSRSPYRGAIRQGAVSVKGRLPPEVIQRIVRQSFGRFRLCYERALPKTPKLNGRVMVELEIDRSGAVSSVRNEGSDLPDTEVVTCVVRAFSGLSFPQPEGGTVSVVYPLIFSPDGPSDPTTDPLAPKKKK